jgi:hypothetical protein
MVATTTSAEVRVRRPRRLTVILGPIASVGVAVTSFNAAAPAVVVPLFGVWLAAFVAGALWSRGGPLMLTALAVTVKLMTVALVVAVLAFHSRIGPQGPLDWIPLGLLNAATGLWFLRLIRGEGK